MATFAEKVGVEEGEDAGLGHVGSDQPPAKSEDVGVIMLARQLG